METSQNGLLFIENHEGVRLQAYQDTHEPPIWTIGVGHTGPDVYEGLIITGDQVSSFLAEDVKIAEDAINNHVTVDLNQNQFDALVSLVFNIGSGNFISSTLLKKLNAGDYTGASQQFPAWCHNGGAVCNGLLKRRNDEVVLFNS